MPRLFFALATGVYGHHRDLIGMDSVKMMTNDSVLMGNREGEKVRLADAFDDNMHRFIDGDTFSGIEGAPKTLGLCGLATYF